MTRRPAGPRDVAPPAGWRASRPGRPTGQLPPCGPTGTHDRHATTRRSERHPPTATNHLVVGRRDRRAPGRPGRRVEVRHDEVAAVLEWPDGKVTVIGNDAFSRHRSTRGTGSMVRRRSLTSGHGSPGRSVVAMPVPRSAAGERARRAADSSGSRLASCSPASRCSSSSWVSSGAQPGRSVDLAAFGIPTYRAWTTFVGVRRVRDLGRGQAGAAPAVGLGAADPGGSRTVRDSRTRSKPRRSYVLRAGLPSVTARPMPVKPSLTRTAIARLSSSDPEPGVARLGAPEDLDDPRAVARAVGDQAGRDDGRSRARRPGRRHSPAGTRSEGAVEERGDVVRHPVLRRLPGLVVGVRRRVGGLGRVEVVLGRQRCAATRSAGVVGARASAQAGSGGSATRSRDSQCACRTVVAPRSSSSRPRSGGAEKAQPGKACQGGVGHVRERHGRRRLDDVGRQQPVPCAPQERQDCPAVDDQRLADAPRSRVPRRPAVRTRGSGRRSRSRGARTGPWASRPRRPRGRRGRSRPGVRGPRPRGPARRRTRGPGGRAGSARRRSRRRHPAAAGRPSTRAGP